MNWTPPTGHDLNFYRGNFCGMTFPDAPVVPGSNGDNPACIMSCLLDNYPDYFVDQYLEKYASTYTHLQRSLGHALCYANIDRFVSITKKAQKLGLYSDVWMIANEFPGFEFNQDASFWKPKLDPYIDRLLGEGCIDLACPSWQMDQVMGSAPGNATISIIAYVAKKLPRSVPVYTHWMNEALAWWKVIGHAPNGSDIGETWVDPDFDLTITISNRFDWWRGMGHYLTGGHHQGDTVAARTKTKEYQLSMCDTLDYFNGRGDKGNMGLSYRRTDQGEPFRMTAFECNGQDEFDKKLTELDGDGVTYALMGARGWNGSHLSGYGNGGRRPSGVYL